MSQFFRKSSQSRVATVAAVTLALVVWAFHKGGNHNISTVQAHSTSEVETIVLMRHGELNAHGLGQLDCQGLNRALALPTVLRSRFGIPSGIYASDPADTITEDGGTYSYVRPLATIEPTAISMGIPVNTEIGYSNISALQTEVTKPVFVKGTVFIAWEHYQAYLFARNMLSTYGENPDQVPAWPSGDFDMLYVFYITPPSGSTKGTLKFEVQQEGLTNTLKTTCPT